LIQKNISLLYVISLFNASVKVLITQTQIAMLKKALLIPVIILFVACHSSKKVTTANVKTEQAATTPENPNADGSSFEKAIVIQETSETNGVSAEYAWLRKQYPGYKFQSQTLSNHNKKPYDILNIETADGEKKAVYFDISNFFGKF
jgi:hypothetical protein